LSDKTIELSNELLETIKIIENCTSCKDNTGKYDIDELHKSINKIESYIKKYKIGILNRELFLINIKLNIAIICEGCKEIKIEKLTDKCGNEETARFLYYDCKLCELDYNEYIQWIPFDELRNVKYLAKGGFGEVNKATWIDSYYDYDEEEYKDCDVVLKRLYNSSDDKIVDILNEVKYIINIINATNSL